MRLVSIGCNRLYFQAIYLPTSGGGAMGTGLLVGIKGWFEGNVGIGMIPRKWL